MFQYLFRFSLTRHIENSSETIYVLIIMKFQYPRSVDFPGVSIAIIFCFEKKIKLKILIIVFFNQKRNHTAQQHMGNNMLF